MQPTWWPKTAKSTTGTLGRRRTDCLPKLWEMKQAAAGTGVLRRKCSCSPEGSEGLLAGGSQSFARVCVVIREQMGKKRFPQSSGGTGFPNCHEQQHCFPVQIKQHLEDKELTNSLKIHHVVICRRSAANKNNKSSHLVCWEMIISSPYLPNLPF